MPRRTRARAAQVLATAVALAAGASVAGAHAAPPQRDPPASPRLDVPYEPTPPEVVKGMVDVAGVRPGDVVYDLGCGDGRIVVEAAKRGARAVGIDIDPRRIAEARANARAAGVEDRVELRVGDLFEADVRPATVVMLYLWPHVNLRLRPLLLAQLRPGARVVSHDHDMGDWKPARTVEAAGARVHLWVVGGEDEAGRARSEMVASQLAARGIRDPQVLEAMAAVERHRFVPERWRAAAYEDRPLPIGHGQTISQPYVVALMTELAQLRRGSRVLEIGTGSGYQAAVLARLGARVFSIEIVADLAREARERLGALGYRDVAVRAGDGFRGWPEEAPFDAILVTAAPPRIPEPLLEQLAIGGRLVAPVGERSQDLVVIERTESGLTERRVAMVSFVPMTGEAQRRR